MMPTAQFLELNANAQRELVLDGMVAIRLRLREAAVLLHKLNGWNQAIHAVEVDAEYIKRYRREAEATRDAADSLTEQILIHSQVAKQTIESVETHKLSERLKNLKAS